MARKDKRLMKEEAIKTKQYVSAIQAIAIEMNKWIEKGNGEKDRTVIAKDNLYVFSDLAF